MNALALYFRPSLLRILLLGFSSGLPLALTASTLFTWLADKGIDKETIGIFAAVSVPYSIKFLWSPLIDGLNLPFFSARFGRRRGWLLAIQLLLMAAIAAFAAVNPVTDPLIFGGIALAVAFFSASQDIVIDAYRVEILPEREQGAAAAMTTLGYRLAMLVSGAGALILSDIAGWHVTYLAMASCMLAGILTTLFMPEPQAPAEAPRKEYKEWLKQSVIAPFTDFMMRPGWLHILIFVLLFRLADAFLGVMFNPFLLEIGFSKTQIAAIVKLYGLLATIGGSFLGGVLVMRWGVYSTLMLTGIGHMLTNMLLALQVEMGADSGFLTLCVISENLTAGMGSAAFIAYLSSLCRVRYTATQYALLSSLAAVARTMLSTESGHAAVLLGWQWFFLLSSLLAVPSLVLLWYIHRRYGMQNPAS